jgi:TolB-like protein
MNFLQELKRRNVFRVGIAYALIAWVILQVIDFLLELTDAPSWVLQVFFITAIVGLPVVLILSWVYEMTPEGIKLEKNIARDHSITPRTGRKLDRIIIALLAATVVFLLAGQFSNMPSPESAATQPVEDAGPAVTEKERLPSIAVLPFVNMSSDPEQEYFADGISEEILNSLARINGLKVAGRTSSFAFKGKNEDLRMIGEALGVENILEGSVRKQGNQVRITAQLIQVEDGFHLWSDTYDRRLDDIFAIQDEIANAILQQAKIQLLEEQAIVTARVNPIAYQNYVAAKQRIHERTRGGLKVAMNLLKDAVQLDPGFAAAWAQLGIATMLSSDGFGSYGEIPEQEAQRMGKEYADKALALDPELAEGHAALGLYWQNQPPFSNETLQRAIDALERSLALDPAPIDTWHWMQRAQQIIGRQDEVQETLEKIVQRDPLYWPGVSNLVSLYVRKNRLAEAHELNDRTMRYRPELQFRQKAALYIFEGRYAEAVPLALEAWEERSDPLSYWPVSRAMWGTHQFDQLAELENAPNSRQRAVTLAYLGRTEEALMIAQSALQELGQPQAIIAVHAMSGQWQRLIEFLESTWTDLEQFDLDFGGGDGGFGNDVMLNIAQAYAETGNDEKFALAMRLVRASHDQAREHGFDNMDFDLAEARYWALAGDEERALEHLSRAVARGFARSPRLSSLYPQMSSLEGNPRYDEIQALSLAHLNEQRALLELPPLEAAY